MADSMREQKLAVARKKLRQFQKKKGTRRVTGSSSKEGTPEEYIFEESGPMSESGTLSSHGSSTDLASEEFVELVAEPFVEVDGQGYFTQRDNGTEGKKDITKEDEQNSVACFAEGQAETEIVPSSADISRHIEEAQNGLQFSQSSAVFDAYSAPTTATPNNTPQAHVDLTHQSSNSFPFQPGLSMNYINHIHDDHTAHETSPEFEPVSNLPIREETLGSESVTNNSLIHPSERNPQTTIENSVAATLSVPEAPSDTGSADGGEGGEGGSVSSETTASVTTAIHVAGREGHTLLKSSSESLRQISLQLSGLMSESEATAPVTQDSTVSELERRNSELAALLLQETQQSQQQAHQIVHLKSQMEQMEAELSGARTMLSPAGGGGVREVEGLREQLQVHIQTIGILVAEKSELQSSLTHATHTLTQRAGQVTELEGRLDAARQRASEAEAEARDSNSQLQAARGSLSTLTKDLDASRTTGFKTSKQCEDLKASVSELTERLSVKTKEYDLLLTQLTENKSQLAMADLHIQQLRDGSREEIQTQLVQAQGQQVETQRQLEEARAALLQAQAENKQVAGQYQQYTAQLVSQLQTMQDMVTNLTEEKNELTTALEASQAQAATAAAATVAEDSNKEAGMSQAEMETERERLLNTITDLQHLTLQLKEQNAAMTNDNSQLSRLVEQLSGQVEELEVEAERNRTEEVDTGRLLEAMQSDKVAAARALTQNRQLKEQLEELQSGFIIMSNKKLELTEKLEKELHSKKGLNKDIAMLEEDMAASRKQLLEKEREAVMLRENSESLGAQLLLARSQSQQEQQRNRMLQELRQENATYAEQLEELEHKLKLSKIDIENLTSQNSELRNMMSSHDLQLPDSTTLPVDSSGQENREESDKEERVNLVKKVGVLSASVSQLEIERNNLQSQLEEERIRYTKLLQESQQNSPIASNGTPESKAAGMNEGVVMAGLQKLQEAHTALEKRFSRSMEEVAQLSDEKQQLEHVVQQLQLETDTIGDYITIYQFQRGVMKQQARERELELSSLRHEREEMKTKLTTLQDLVSVLGQEKGSDWERLNKMTSIIQSHSTMANGVENGETETEGEGSTKDPEEEEPDGVQDKVSGASDSVPGTINTSTQHHQQQHVEGGGIDKAGGSKKSPTVQRILDLLNEMEASSHVELGGLQKFHPCPLCSGKLITV